MTESTFHRVSPLILMLLTLHGWSAEDFSGQKVTQNWPVWDGHETIEQYAKRARLQPTKTIDLGDGVSLEMVLIPAGKFTMGMPIPMRVDEKPYRRAIVTGQAVFALGTGILLALMGTVVIHAIRVRRWPQYSLARFVAMIVATCMSVLGGMHWWGTARALHDAEAEYRTAVARHQDSYETQAKEVVLERPFYVGRHEVTQEQYELVAGKNPSQFKGASFPVEHVLEGDAKEYCKKLGILIGDLGSGVEPVRLLSEAEWEYACRAGTRTFYCAGDSESDLSQVGWYYGNSNGGTHSVGQKAPNAWGLYDMHGNVWEWTQGNVDCVLRGGAWDSDRTECRAENRCQPAPIRSNAAFGFRVALDVEDQRPAPPPDPK